MVAITARHLEILQHALGGDKHGKGMRRLYQIWKGAKGRCFNPNNAAFEKYGGRGITMCDRWRYSFKNFAEDMGKCPPGKSLDRKDNDGPYAPDNCRWATKQEQANNRRTNRRVEANGKTQTITEWAIETGISESLIRARIDRLGWTEEQALTRPSGSRWRWSTVSNSGRPAKCHCGTCRVCRHRVAERARSKTHSATEVGQC